MKALFLTTKTSDCFNHVRGWVSAFGPAEHMTFNYGGGIRNDWKFVDVANEIEPDIIFYIGAQSGINLPRRDTFLKLRESAPLINICSDAADYPWHPTLIKYREEGCFDAQVALDGARAAPVDIATLTPVDPYPFGADDGISVPRDIRCGFSGSVGEGPRGKILDALGTDVQIRNRVDGQDNYQDHADFMRKCRLIINSSFTGTGERHHVKGRVLEAGWAGCALLESEGSPIGEWFPEDCYFIYKDAAHAANLIRNLSDGEIEHAASRLSEIIRERYTAAKIYGEILDRVQVGCA